MVAQYRALRLSRQYMQQSDEANGRWRQWSAFACGLSSRINRVIKDIERIRARARATIGVCIAEYHEYASSNLP